MKQNTAMMELIEILERAKLHFVENRQIVSAIDSCKLCAVDLLEKEKEQIINAHFTGWSDAYDYLDDDTSEPSQAIDYYNETYKQD